MLPVILKTDDTAKTIKMHYQEISYKNYDITLIYDKKFNLFGILINGEHRGDILTLVFEDFYTDGINLFRDEDEQEIDLELVSIIYNNI